MNLSLQIGRGLTALALSAALSAYAMIHAPRPAVAALPRLAAVSVAAPPRMAGQAGTRAAQHSQRCATRVEIDVSVGPIAPPAAP